MTLRMLVLPLLAVLVLMQLRVKGPMRTVVFQLVERR